jgi:hypothetical protein
MKKIVRLSESDLLIIVKKVLSEQVIQGKGSDPYEYKKEGGKYYTRKKGSTSWILTKDTAASAIATKIFKDTLPQTTVNKPSPKLTPVSSTTRPDTNIGSDTTTKQGALVTSITKNIMGELDKATQLIGNISPRSYAQLNKIIQSKGLASDSFIIVNKDASIAALFAPNYKFVGKSPITSGYFKDTGSKEDTLTYPKWFKISIQYALENPDSPYAKKVQTQAKNVGVKLEKLDYLKHVKGKGKDVFSYSYQALKQNGYAKTPSGVYKLGNARAEKGYSGEGKNLFPLVDIETGERLAQAVHGAAGKGRESILTKAGSEDTSKSKDYTRAGSGCVNVDANFIRQMQKYDPQYVIILPDSGATVDIPKVVPIQTWSEKIAEMGSNCVRSFINLFS